MTRLVNWLWPKHPYLAQTLYLVYLKLKGSANDGC